MFGGNESLWRVPTSWHRIAFWPYYDTKILKDGTKIQAISRPFMEDATRILEYRPKRTPHGPSILITE
jgi:hypothetical protein